MEIFKIIRRLAFFIFPFLKPKLNYFALGDSTVEGVGVIDSAKSYPAQLTKLLTENFRVNLVNFGKSGATSYDVLEFQVPKALLNSEKPQLITLSVGPNDIRKLKTVGEFKKNFDLILKFLKHTKAKIIVNTIPDMSRLPAIPKLTRWVVKKRVEQFNKVIHNLAKEHKIALCDLYSKSREFEKPEIYLASDGFHLSETGYEIWAKCLYFDLKPLLLK